MSLLITHGLGINVTWFLASYLVGESLFSLYCVSLEARQYKENENKPLVN